MGSRSCYVGAEMGGYKGRIQARGDVLNRGDGPLLSRARSMPKDLIPVYLEETLLRAVEGPQSDYFDRGLQTFFESEFSVSPHANRMGYRLDGPPILHKEGVAKSIISEPSLPGGVQVTPDGQPIILLVEQTVGGYTKIATLVSSDISRVAQTKPGDRIRFEKTDLEKAHIIYRQQRELQDKIKARLEAI